MENCENRKGAKRKSTTGQWCNHVEMSGTTLGRVIPGQGSQAQSFWHVWASAWPPPSVITAVESNWAGAHHKTLGQGSVMVLDGQWESLLQIWVLDLGEVACNGQYVYFKVIMLKFQEICLVDKGDDDGN